MAIITIRGSLGSWAPEIGRKVAKGINADYIDREIIAEVAARIVWPENAVEAKETPACGLLDRIADALKYVYTSGTGLEGVYLPTWQIALDDNRYLAGLQSVINDLAKSKSVVICGRGSQFILKDYPNAFHVLVMAPLEVRLKRVMENLGTDEENTRKEITRFDSSHREFTKKYFNAEIEDPANYDLIINTKHIDLDTAAGLITTASSSKVENKKVKTG